MNEKEPLPYYKWLWKDFRANKKVQKMDYITKGLYRELIDEVWAEGFIPNDINKLSDLCECPKEVMMKAWAMLAPCFYEIGPGCLVNRKLETLRTDTDAKRAKAAVSGALGGKAKHDRISSERHIEEEEKSREENNTLFEADLSAKIVVDRAKLSDDRHNLFKEEINKYWKSKNASEIPWNGSEGSKLKAFLAANPKMKAEDFTQLLRYRYLSEENHSERPRVWIESLNRYGSGPLDRFGKPKNGKITNSRSTLIESRDEIRAEIRHAHSVSGRVLHNLESGAVKTASATLLEVPRKVHD